MIQAGKRERYCFYELKFIIFLKLLNNNKNTSNNNNNNSFQM